MQDIQLRGKWWLPSNPSTQIMGDLRTEQYSNPTLDLERPFWDDSFARVSEPEIILGELEDTRRITLYKINPQTNILNSSSFKADFVFIGRHFHNRNEIMFESIDIHYSDIDSWIPIHNFERYSSAGQETHQCIENKAISLYTDQRFKIDLLSKHENTVKPRIYFRIKSSNEDRRPFDNYLEMKNII